MLVVYGGVSLWLAAAGISSSPVRSKACAIWLCPEQHTDSPAIFDEPPDQGLEQAQARLADNPASAYRWMDLAAAEINADHVEQGNFCLRQALAAAPGNPAILFRAANLYLRLQDYADTLRNLTTVLRNPDLVNYYDRVFALYSQMDLPLEDLLDRGVPPTPQAADGFLHFWIRQEKLEEAQTTWTWMSKNSLANLTGTTSLVTLLAKNNRWSDAVQVWSNYTQRLDPAYLKTNWVYNGDFEMSLVDSPFDWHLQPSEKVSVARDSEVFDKGAASLRIIFNGRREATDALAYQTVLLPAGHWQIKAWMKTSSLTSNQGVVVRVVDADHPGTLDVATPFFHGTGEWTPLSRSFDVAAGPARIRVEILRPPSTDFDSRMMGKIWIDDIELQPDAAAYNGPRAN